MILFFFSFAVHVTGLVTNPPVENGGTVIVAAPENASNVTIYCAVTGPNSMTIATVWIHIDSNANPSRQGISSNDPVFNTGPLPFANLTIKSFAQSLDGTTLECSNMVSPPQIAFFTLRIISKLRVYSPEVIILFVTAKIENRTPSTHDIVHPINSCGRQPILIHRYCAGTWRSSPSFISVDSQWSAHQQHQPQCVCVPQHCVQFSGEDSVW